MSQYRDYDERIRISDTDIVITATLPNGSQLSNTVVRDGSMDANFKAAMAAHRDAVLSLKASSTSPPCYVAVKGKWIKTTASPTIITADSIIKVPTGNSGILVLHLDTSAYTVKYSKNGGAYTTIVDGGTVTVANNDLLKFEALSVVSSDFVNGSVTDQDTGVEVDTINLLNSTP